MDLIYREKLANKLTALDMPNGIEKEQYFIVMCNVIHALFEEPAVEAVPVDKLCEWLVERYLFYPCQIINDCDGWYLSDCVGHDGNKVACWKKVLTKWMEGLDGSD